MNSEQTIYPFAVKDCALIAIATGIHVQNLRELKDKLLTIHPGSIYYHFWGSLLNPRFEEPEFNNDFAAWTYHALHDPILAERLAVIDPTEFADIEDLRQELIDVIEERLYEIEYVPWSKPDQQFHFIRSQIVVFDTHKRITEPKELAKILPSLSTGSIFYHFIDARRRTKEKIDDFRAWLKGFGDTYADLCSLIAAIDPYFTTLAELRQKLSQLFELYFGGK
ncbi:MAG TPA: hypothetical protein ENG63_10460 [Candidatus Desulfofervidus auxilii]|uniref:Uncharacterized protein n=1 Tax=Desulfofervidus auxilii TaxID=1621989 RepID=A0A7C0Y5Z8_DESA2|nr:hypothetical protein [Candidatus Desulfofervidus auxilii]